MADVDRLVAIIRQNGLDALPQASKDSLEVQALQFARSVRSYALAAAEAIKAGDLKLSDEAGNRYELAAQLYAPGLVEALATAVLELADG